MCNYSKRKNVRSDYNYRSIIKHFLSHSEPVFSMPHSHKKHRMKRVKKVMPYTYEQLYYLDQYSLLPRG